MKKESLWTKDFLGISFISFFLFVVFYILLTTLPIYVLEDLNSSESAVGLVTGIFLISAVLCRPFTGKWIDSIGRKKILLFSVFIFFFSSLFYQWADSIPFLIALRFFHGIGFGMATTATGAIVADLIPEKRKGEGLGYYALFMNLAMVIGPFTGLTIVQYANFSWVFTLCLIMTVIALLLSFIVRFPEAAVSSEPHALKKKDFSLSSFFETKAIPIAIVGGILALAYSGVLSFISIYANELGLMEAASFFFVVYAAFTIASRPFTGRWFDIYGENRIVYPAIILFAVGMLLLSQATNTFFFLLAGGLIGLGYGNLSPALQTIAIQNADPAKRGLATSTFFTFFDTGIGLGSYALGVIAVYTGFSSLYFILGGVVLLALIAYYFLHGRKVSWNGNVIQPSKNIT
ncbi:MFS transporter [Cytobacillus purgationiresistens]|uniref:MFS family permease n=1 Tax=Cytobacillus purgationiresistens TaxID=863449 RepID=A0ABU0AKH6_9BACI|nr:MFS transporter [Cytobacillus purgationiresistens]MDQ0271545.1 MFS family permease [Cytobacillus purgationiresistens]